MSLQFGGCNVVVAASQFNPSVFKPSWLEKNGLIDEAELEAPYVFSEGIAQAKTQEFLLLLVPGQLQFTPLSQSEEDQQQVIVKKVGAIVRHLPHTPYTAMGLNFSWLMAPPEGTSMSQESNRLFFKGDSTFFKHFDCEDAHFGGYASKNILGCRLKVDVKPVIVMEEPGDRLMFLFNYHKDLSATDDVVGTIEEMLAHWKEARAYALAILNSI